MGKQFYQTIYRFTGSNSDLQCHCKRVSLQFFTVSWFLKLQPYGFKTYLMVQNNLNGFLHNKTTNYFTATARFLPTASAKQVQESTFWDIHLLHNQRVFDIKKGQNKCLLRSETWHEDHIGQEEASVQVIQPLLGVLVQVNVPQVPLLGHGKVLET